MHFRDIGTIRQIEDKVVNRLRQVTSAIKQDGANQVSIITSCAEITAVVAFAQAAVIRPKMIGEAPREMSGDPDAAGTLFEILETKKILENKGKLTLLVQGGQPPLLTDLLASRETAAARRRRATQGSLEPPGEVTMRQSHNHGNEFYVRHHDYWPPTDR